MTEYRLRVEPDTDAENPADWECTWTPYSFSTRHINFKNPEEFEITGVGESDDAELQAKFDKGLAWVLSYYEHSGCRWMLAGGLEWANTPDKMWDGVAIAGLLVWEGKEEDMGAETREKRAEDAARFLENYTAWCNGHVYWAGLETSEECESCHHVEHELGETCGGFYDEESIVEFVRDLLIEGDKIVKVVGDCAFLVENVDWEQALAKESA